MSIWLEGQSEKGGKGENKLPVGVEDGTARGLARDGLVEDWRQIRAVLEGGVEGRDGHDGAGRLHARRRPHIPRQPDPCAAVTAGPARPENTHRRAPRRPQS
jgi:hypothetical protein